MAEFNTIRNGAGFPVAQIGAGLPVTALVAEVTRAVRDTRTAVVEAPPGTGKTTVIPPAVANAVGAHPAPPGPGAPSRVLVTGPRRIAVRAAARRLAGLIGQPVGRSVGFTVRGESAVSAHTRIEFVTSGVLVRRLLADPALEGVGAVILDEIHERHLESDLAFAMVRELLELRDDLAVVAMSATVDAARWAGLLGLDTAAPVVSVPALTHPLAIEWVPPPAGVARLDHRGPTHAFLDHVAATTERTWRRWRSDPATQEEGAGSVLVFLPGAREVDQVRTRLQDRLAGEQVDIVPLSGSLSAREQDAALTPPTEGRPRIIVSTAVAESSLTVPGVRCVVDACLSREPRLDTLRGISGLVTVTVSRAAATQRAGRAARLGPGLAVRCLADEDWARLDAYPPPAITTADLTSFALDVAMWGTPRAEGLALPDPPPVPALDRAEDVLRGLEALDERGAITDRGRAIARIPADPRHARALLDGAEAVGGRAAAEIVALLAHEVRAPGADLAAALRALHRGETPAATQWRREADRLHRLLDAVTTGHPPRGGGPAATSSARETDIARVVSLAFPDRIARRRGGPDSTSYTLASGTGASLPRDSGLRGSPWLAVADLSRATTGTAAGDGALIRAAVPLTPEDALAAGSALLTDTEHATWTTDKGRGRVSARRIRALGAIELTSTPTTASREAARDAVRRALASQGLGLRGEGMFTWSDNGQTLARRLQLLHHLYGDPWPSMAEADLLGRWQEWLHPEIDALVDGGRADHLDMTSALRRLLPWPAASRLDDLVPERLEVPTGSRIRLQYPPLDDPAARPVLAVKLQECFGWTDTPTLCEGQVRVLLHLLSPAGRPLAITDDLASFWANAYAQVRAENRARYAKHPWPEDPLTAPPRRGTTRSGR